MAIDTAEKRRSIAGIGGRRARPGVTPNAAKDAEWRQEVGRSYSGIAASAIAWRTIIGDVFNYDTARHGASLSFYFETVLLALVGTVRARLYSTTTSTAVPGSEVSTASSTATRLRSGPLTLVDGNDYFLQVGKQGTDAGIAGGSKLIAF